MKTTTTKGLMSELKTLKGKELYMKGYRAKIKNRIPCHGVIGGVVEIPPDTRKGRKMKKRDKRVEQLIPRAQENVIVNEQEARDASARTFMRVLFVCLLLFLIIILKS